MSSECNKMEETLKMLPENELRMMFHRLIRQDQQQDSLQTVLKILPEKEVISGKSEGNTPLHIAAEFGNLRSVELLYKYLKELSTREGLHGKQKPWRLRNSEGNTPFHVAIIYQNVEVAEYLLDKDPDLARFVNQDGEAPLHLAVTHHIHLDECRSAKGKIESLINVEVDQLMIGAAVERSSLSMIETLVTKASYVALWPDKDGLTPLLRAGMFVGSRNIKNVVLTIIRHCPESAEVSDPLGNSILHKLAGRNISYNECQELLKKPSIHFLRNHQNKQGDTPLHIAMSKGDISLAKALWWDKAKLGIRNKAGISVAYLIEQKLVHETREMTSAESQAADEGDEDYFSERLKCLDTDFLLAKDSSGRNVLHKLMQMENKKHIDYLKLCNLIKGLVSVGSKQEILSQRDLMGDTPIHVLMRNQKNTHMLVLILQDLIGIEATQWLLLRNELGNTPLHEAIIADNCLMQSLLNIYENNSNRSPVWLVENEQGNTPLHLAIIANNTTLVSKLLELYDKHTYKICCLLQQNKQGNTPIHLALIANKPRIVKELALFYEKYSQEDPCYLTNAQRKGLWLLQNLKGDTPVHVALITRNFTFVRQLLEYDSSVADISNINGNSPLNLISRYLADCEQLENEELKSLIDAFKVATTWPTKECQTMLHIFVLEFPLCLTRRLTNVYKNDMFFEDLIKKKNCDEKTPLHLAIGHQFFEHATLLIQFYPQVLKEKDNEGKTALHHLLSNYGRHAELINQCLAVSKTENIAKYLLKLEDNNGIMPLHLLIESGDFSFTQQCFEIVQEDIASNVILAKTLLNGNVPYRDKNTLLHLAIQGRYFGLVYDLLNLAKNGDQGMGVVYVDNLLEKENKSGTKPIDLIAAISDLPPKLEELFLGEPKFRGIRSIYGITKPQMQDYVNTMGVIAALLTTISFTAAFTVPGGLIQDKGTPLFIRDPAFQIFMIFNVLTMCLSTVVLFCLLWILATREHRKSVKLMDFSMSLLQISFYTILIAFMTGVYATFKPVNLGMAIYTLALCSLVTVAMRKYYMVEYIAHFGVEVSIFVEKFLPDSLICRLFKPCCKKPHDQSDQNPPV